MGHVHHRIFYVYTYNHRSVFHPKENAIIQRIQSSTSHSQCHLTYCPEKPLPLELFPSKFLMQKYGKLEAETSGASQFLTIWDDICGAFFGGGRRLGRLEVLVTLITVLANLGIWQWSGWPIRIDIIGMEIIQGWAADRCFSIVTFSGGKKDRRMLKNFCSEIPRKKSYQVPRIPTQLACKVTIWKNGRQIHHFETALQVVGALVAPKDLIFRLFLDSSFNKNSRKPSNMIHLGGANFFLAPEAPKKPTCSPQSILSIHPIAPLAWEKDPLRPKRKLRKFCLEMTPSWNPIRSWFLSRIWPLDGWRFFGRKAKNNWPTEAFYIRNSPTHLINILKLHWIGKQFDMECTNSKVR